MSYLYARSNVKDINVSYNKHHEQHTTNSFTHEDALIIGHIKYTYVLHKKFLLTGPNS